MKRIEPFKDVPNLRVLYETGGLRAVGMGLAHVFDHWRLQFSVRRYFQANHLSSGMHPDSIANVEAARRAVRKDHARLDASAGRLHRNVRHSHPKAPGMHG